MRADQLGGEDMVVQVNTTENANKKKTGDTFHSVRHRHFVSSSSFVSVSSVWLSRLCVYVCVCVVCHPATVSCMWTADATSSSNGNGFTADSNSLSSSSAGDNSKYKSMPYVGAIIGSSAAATEPPQVTIYRIQREGGRETNERR